MRARIAEFENKGVIEHYPNALDVHRKPFYFEMILTRA